MGINHNGNLKTALKMIAVAKKAGADAVKFQTFTADEFVGDPKQTFTYQSQGKKVTESMLEMFRRYELPKDAWARIKRRCDDEGIGFLSTPQNRSDLDLLLEVGVSAIKVGSDDFTNIPLLKDYAKAKLPMIVSCGMADLKEVRASLSAIRGVPAVLLLCTSQYPTPPRDVNLRKLATLRKEFPGLTLGFSDHTQGPLASSLAVAYGACVFEKHFTLNRDLPGPDHWFSENPEGLHDWVASIRTAYKMLGSGVVKPTPAEEKMKIFARRSIVAIDDIKKGDPLDPNKIGLRRPGGGLPPAVWDKVLGRKASRAVSRGSLLKAGDYR
ncbi:MAG: N-acetylneuraminate synthase family protein [Elusimicrobia bacterium]|nr:N-acetylneuraminate synthase family protein [Elusimicrobiota bacterium]